MLSLSQMKVIGQNTEVCGLKSVSLHRCSVDLKSLIAVLQSCQSLSALEIELTQLTRLQIMAIDTYLVQNGNLKKLVLKNVSLT